MVKTLPVAGLILQDLAGAPASNCESRASGDGFLFALVLTLAAVGGVLVDDSRPVGADSLHVVVENVIRDGLECACFLLVGEDNDAKIEVGDECGLGHHADEAATVKSELVPAIILERPAKSVGSELGLLVGEGLGLSADVDDRLRAPHLTAGSREKSRLASETGLARVVRASI